MPKEVMAGQPRDLVIDLAEITSERALVLLASTGATAAGFASFRRWYPESRLSREHPQERAYLLQASERIGRDAEQACIDDWCADGYRVRSYHLTRARDPSVLAREGLHAHRDGFWQAIRAVALEHPLGPRLRPEEWAAAHSALLSHHMVSLKMAERDVYVFLDRRCIGAHGHTNPRQRGPEFWQDLLYALMDYCSEVRVGSRWVPGPLLTEGTIGCTVVCEMPVRRLDPECRRALLSAVVSVSLPLFDVVPEPRVSSMCLSFRRVAPDEIARVEMGSE